MADVFQHSTALSWLPPPDETKIIVHEFLVNLSGEDSYSLSSATRTVRTTNKETDEFWDMFIV